MTIADRILHYLMQHPEGADDDELAVALDLKYRQQANSRCRLFAAKGIIVRKKVNGKIRNFYLNTLVTGSGFTPELQNVADPEELWCWEGNVQQSVADYLRDKENCTIINLANPKTRQRGKDIIAKRGTGIIWVTVKGYPKGTKKTHPSTQAGHWFKDALYDMICWRGQDPDAELAMALPNKERYRKLINTVVWLQSAVPFSIIWVNKDGGIDVTPGFR